MVVAVTAAVAAVGILGLRDEEERNRDLERSSSIIEELREENDSLREYLMFLQHQLRKQQDILEEQRKIIEELTRSNGGQSEAGDSQKDSNIVD